MIPVLVGGTGRSGTSIVKRTLGAHHAVSSIQAELRILVDPDGVLDLVRNLDGDWNPQRADTAAARFRRLLRNATGGNRLSRLAWTRLSRGPASVPRYAILSLDAEFGADVRKAGERLLRDLGFVERPGHWMGTKGGLRPRLLESTWPNESLPAVQRFLETLYRASEPEASHWLDDTPYNLLHAAELVQWFPTARFVHVHRDPRDVVASHLQMSWGGDDVATAAKRVASALRRWQDQRRSVPKDQVLEVRMEDLVARPRPVMESILAHAGLDLDDGVRAAMDAIQPKQAHEGRWRKEIPEDLHDVLHEALADVLPEE